MMTNIETDIKTETETETLQRIRDRAAAEGDMERAYILDEAIQKLEEESVLCPRCGTDEFNPSYPEWGTVWSCDNCYLRLEEK